MKQKQSCFNYPFLAYLLVTPQILITILFFIMPTFTAIKESFYLSDPLNLHTHFVWFKNFQAVFADADYLTALKGTIIFSFGTTVLALVGALYLALLTNRVIRGHALYKTLLIWPYAVAPAVAGILWRFMFNPTIGIITEIFNKLGYNWNYLLNSKQAMSLITLSAAWQQFSYNYIFFLAALSAIPNSLIESAMLEGAGAIRRFYTIILPLLSPTLFFLLIINLIYSFFDTFGIIQTITQGGPDNATNILVYKVFNDGFIQLNLGNSYAQSVILIIIVVALTVLQFRYIERKVHY